MFEKILRLIAGIFLAFFVLLYGQEQPIKVACVGNSITYGAGISDVVNDSYPAQLQKLLGDDYKVGNFGNSGRTMLKKGDYPLWVEPEFRGAINMVPDIVIILLGTNDTKPYNWIYKDEFIPDYIAMIDTFRTINPQVQIYACLPPPAFSVQWDIRDSVLTADTIPMIQKIADSTNVNVIDFYNPFINSNDLFPDDIHPNADGAWEMAKVVYEALTGKQVIKSQDINLALFKTVAVTSPANVESPQALVDGDRNTSLSCSGTSCELFIDLEKDEKMNQIYLNFGQGGASESYQYAIDVSQDGSNWQNIIDQTVRDDSTNQIAVENFEVVTARYVKLSITGKKYPFSEDIVIYEFSVLSDAPIHAPIMTFNMTSITNTSVRFTVTVQASSNLGEYIKVFSCNDPEDPMTASKGYRLFETQDINGSIREGRVRWYWAIAYKDGLEISAFDTLKIDWSISSIKSKSDEFVPENFQLYQNYPNPFNPYTLINYQVASHKNLKMNVYNIRGEKVRDLVNGSQRMGNCSVIWDGTDDLGHQVASGVYLYDLVIDGVQLFSKKMLLLR